MSSVSPPCLANQNDGHTVDRKKLNKFFADRIFNLGDVFKDQQELDTDVLTK